MSKHCNVICFVLWQKLMSIRTAIIVLQRPFVLQKADSNDPQESISWQSSALQKAKTAATNINTVLSRLIDLNMVKYLKPMT